jgi:protein farnesyltransferase/geranylgeranyltransferase type-1 subunit alpha
VKLDRTEFSVPMSTEGDDDEVMIARPAYAEAYIEASTRLRAFVDVRDGDTGAPGRGNNADALERMNSGDAAEADAMTVQQYTEGLRAADDVIASCSAHYTAWATRWRCAKALAALQRTDADARAVLYDELEYAEKKTMKSAKNYQVWNHARLVLGAIPIDVHGIRERAFAHVNAALGLDAKNIHAWSHRAWCVERFDAWEDEWEFTKRAIECDWRNNSAWNSRFQCVLRAVKNGTGVEAIRSETAFSTGWIERDADNESAWNYLRGLCDLVENEPVEEPFAREIVAVAVACARASVRGDVETKSRHGLLFLADRAAARATRDADASRVNHAVALFGNLITLDPLRGNYYRGRVDRLHAAVTRIGL